MPAFVLFAKVALALSLSSWSMPAWPASSTGSIVECCKSARPTAPLVPPSPTRAVETVSVPASALSMRSEIPPPLHAADKSPCPPRFAFSRQTVASLARAPFGSPSDRDAGYRDNTSTGTHTPGTVPWERDTDERSLLNENPAPCAALSLQPGSEKHLAAHHT